MDILYITTTLHKQTFDEIFTIPSQFPGQQIQKYHRQLIEGLSQSGARLIVVSLPPVSRKSYKRLFRKPHVYHEDKVTYNEAPIVNVPGLKSIVFIIYALWIGISSKHDVVTFDLLNITTGFLSSMISRLRRKSLFAVVTDLPEHIFGIDSKLTKLIYLLSKNSSLFLVVTEEMNRKINPQNRPYIVIEGQATIINENMDDSFVDKCCIYAGGLHERYGINILVEAFLKLNDLDIELHIYGRGDYESQLIDICSNNQKIHYFGEQPNQFVVEKLRKAVLLLNPRPSDEEFVKYSFPSKTLEFMSTGTPLLTTKLPCIPEEYDPYLYYFKDETVDGMSERMREILNYDPQTLSIFGKEAQKWVFENKSNIVQCKKIYDFLSKNGY